MPLVRLGAVGGATLFLSIGLGRFSYTTLLPALIAEGQVSAVQGGKVTLPDEYAGMLMVFRSFDEMSYGIIFRGTSEVRILDKVRNP